MQVWKTLQKSVLSAALLISSACATPPYYVGNPQQQIIVQDEKYVGYDHQKKPLEGSNFKEKITFDMPIILNRFYSHLTKEISDRIYVDLQDSRIRDVNYVIDAETYKLYVRNGFSNNSRHGDLAEQEFQKQVFEELRKITNRAIRDTVKDMELYEKIKPFFEFNLRRDKIPFTQKTLGDVPIIPPVISQKKDSPMTQEHSEALDNFEDIIRNPQKVHTIEQFSLDWLVDKMKDVAVGMNVNFDVLTLNSSNVQPYMKWMDMFKWTYSLRDRTIEHKAGFSFKGFGIGLSASTNDMFDEIRKIDANFTYTFNGKISVGVGGYHVFEAETEKGHVNEDSGAQLFFFMKF